MKHETIEAIITTLKFISGIGSLSFFALWQFGVVQSSIHFNQILKGWREREMVNFNFMFNKILRDYG